MFGSWVVLSLKEFGVWCCFKSLACSEDFVQFLEIRNIGRPAVSHLKLDLWGICFIMDISEQLPPEYCCNNYRTETVSWKTQSSLKITFDNPLPALLKVI